MKASQTPGAVMLALNVATLAALRVVGADAAAAAVAAVAPTGSFHRPEALPGARFQRVTGGQQGSQQPDGAPRAEHVAHGPARPTEPLAYAAEPLVERERVYPIMQPVATIGRALENTVTLLDPSVSREHALLTLSEGGWRVENLSRRNPLWVGPALIAPGNTAPLPAGAVLRIGATYLQFLAPPVSPASPTGAVVDERFTPASARGGGMQLGEMNPLRPGVTLQFALRGRLSRSAWWALAIIAAVVFVASAIITLDVAALAGQVALANGGLRQALTAVTIPLAPALGVALVVGALDRYEREPLLTMLGAFLWGAVIAIPPALIIERALTTALMGQLLGQSSALALARLAAQAGSAGVIEELVKGAGLVALLLVLRDEFDNVTDGMIYGALIGAGFAMVENVVYFATAPQGELAILIVGRIALGWLSHSTFTSLFGAGLGYIRETRDRRARWLAPLGGLLGAIILHTYFDFTVFVASALMIPGALVFGVVPAALPALVMLMGYIPLFLTQLALLTMALAALRREAAIVRAYLANEVLAGVITPDEYLLAQDARIRSRVERGYGLAYGAQAYLMARALYQSATGLAFRKWHVEMGDPPKRGDRQPEEVYRERIARLRRALASRTA